MPRHVNPRPRAIAPYNFVPLPNKVYSVAEGLEINGERIKPWEKHNQFVPGTHSGWIELKIKTLTPLFIRGPVKKGTDGEWDKREARLRPEPFTTPDGKPMIPGSSLRGMVRTLVEILSFSKIAPVTREKPFFRTFSKDGIGDAYISRMTRSDNRPQGGFLYREDEGWAIRPCDVLRLKRSDFENETGFHFVHSPKYTPPWKYQHQRCYVQRIESSDAVRSIRMQSEPPGEGWIPGILVLTGDMMNKVHEYVFLEPSAQRIPIPEFIWDRFHDEDQLTKWQEEAFPRDKPQEKCRKANGHLRDGEPVFFLCDKKKKDDENPFGLLFLGRAQMFRFPYDKSPWDLTPDEIKGASLDLAEAMFGKVKQEGRAQDQTIRGRIFFEDSIATSGGPDWFEEVMYSQILLSPKVTTYQHYLTQLGTKKQKYLATYLTGHTTTIRGHKLYWHRWDETKGLKLVKYELQNGDFKDSDDKKQVDDEALKLHPRIRPVKTEIVFSGRIRFENLADIELGALLSALELPKGCAHKLGMGKPLGLGSVQIQPELYIVERDKRYHTWEELRIQKGDKIKYCTAFETEMLDHARKSGETFIQIQSGLRHIARLDAMYLLLDWENRPPDEETRYMVIKGGDETRFPPDSRGEVNEYRTRPVLPTPHSVAGLKVGTDIPTLVPSSTEPKPVLKGQTRNGILKRSGDQWFALFEGDKREAVIDNQGEIPEDAQDGDKAEFYIIEQSKKAGIKTRFERLKT
jgi:CRISPR-associated protein (TIGR03986 family)